MKKITLLIAFFVFYLPIQAQTYLEESFDTEIPASWTITDEGGATEDSWASGKIGANSLNGSNAAFVNSDANGDGVILLETLTSPAFDASAAVGLFLDFQQFYNNIGLDRAIVEVYDGTDWIEILNQDADAGAFNAPNLQHINITAYKNANMQVRFIYNDADTWAWYWMIDNVRVYNSTCDGPTALTANVAATTVDLSWTAGGSETVWEVINQEAGGTAPTDTDSGTEVSTNPYQITGLIEGTNYEFYVRANCGDQGFSAWSSVGTYSVAGPGDTCENPIIVPSALPYTTDDNTANYGNDYSGTAGTNCGVTFGTYLGGDDVVYAYTPSADAEVTIAMTPGDTWSGLFVYTDCADIGTTCANGIGNSNTNVREIILPVTAGTTYYIVISTYPDPESTSYNLTITENTCTDATATYTVVDNCDVAPGFFVDVDITDLGSATSLTITDDQTSAPQVLSALGIATFGPYANGTEVVFTISDDNDANCVITSTTLTQAACPPDNDLCADALPIACGDTATGNTSAATGTGAPAGTCGTGTGAPGVWYTFTGSASGEIVDVALCGSAFDTKLQVYEGSCNALTCVVGNDDSCGLQSEATFVSEPNVVYYIYVYGFGSNTGAYSLSLTCTELPDPATNDECVDAIAATVNDDETCDILNAGTIFGATASNVPASTCIGNPDDDVWFEFTASNEVQLISILNMTGGTTNLDHGVYSGNCGSLTELYCSTETNSVTPELTVGNTYYVRVFSNGSAAEITAFDLCIKKAPNNIICENAANFCGEGGALYGSNIIGIDDDTSVACLGTIPNPSWNIIQIGESGSVNIQIVQNTEFDDQGNPIGDELDVDFVLWGPFDTTTDFCALDLLQDCPSCPFSNIPDNGFYPFGNIIDCSYSADAVETVTIDNAVQGEIYALLVTNFSDDPGTIQIQQTNSGETGAGTTVAAIQVTLEDDQDLCGFDEYEIVADSPFADVYEWYANGFVIEGETSSTLTVTESNTYTVIAIDNNCSSTAEESITVNFYSEPTANAVDNIVTCDDVSADGVENFELEIRTSDILGDADPSDFVVTYYATIEDAQQGINALTSPYTNTSSPQTIYARVEDVDAVGTTSGCFAITTFDLVISGPVPTATSTDMNVCDDNSSDGIEDFILTDNDLNVLDGQDPDTFSVSYYVSEEDANAGTAALTSPYTNTTNPQTIFVRVENTSAFDCYAITDLDLIVDDVPFATFNTDEMDYEVCPEATVPIEISLIPQDYTAADVTVVWERDGGVITGQSGLTLPVLEEGTYTAFITFNTSGCTYEVSQDVIELESCVIPQGISPNGDQFNETFDLSSFDVTRIEIFNRYGRLVYSKDNYTNEWHGQTNEGDQLPIGTYFYTMSYRGGAETKSAWVYINE